MEKELLKMLSIIADANKLASDGRYDEAKKMLENEISEAEKSGDYPEGNCFEFSEPIEQLLFMHRNPQNAVFEKSREPIASLYMTYANLLLGFGEIEKADKMFKKSILYNPINPKAHIGCANIYRAKYDTESVIELTLDNFKNAYTSEILGELYGNLGYCYVEKEMWAEAMGCYLMSLHYNSSNADAKKEIKYIQERTEGEAGIPSIDEFRESATKLGIPVGPDDEIVGIAASYGHKALADGRDDVAQYFLKIVYDLTDDEEAYAKLQQIEEKNATIAENML